MHDPNEIQISPGMRAFRSLYTTLCILLLIASLIVPTMWRAYNATLHSANTAPAPVNSSDSIPASGMPQNTPTHKRRHTVSVPESADAQVPPAPTQAPHQPVYRLTLVEPIPSNGRTVSFVMQQCHRDSDHVVCVMTGLNSTDAIINQIDTVFENAVDDEGNTLSDEGGFARFSLMPGVPMKLAFHLREPHSNATKVSIQMRWDSDNLRDGIHRLAFPNIPIQ